MPVTKVGRKWRIGHGKAIYKTKRSAMRAYRGYLWSKAHGGRRTSRRRRSSRRRR